MNNQDVGRAPSGQALVSDEAAAHLHPSGFDPSRCDDCGGVNPAWFAPNALWNRVIGGPDAKGDPGGFVCPGCFIARAEALGIRPSAWQLRHETADDWNDIATAPRDRPILAWWPHLERPVIAWISRGGASIGRWTFASFKFEHQTPVVAPTRWMSLPKPPQAELERAASGTLTEGGDAKLAPGDSLSGPVPQGGAHDF